MVMQRGLHGQRENETKCDLEPKVLNSLELDEITVLNSFTTKLNTKLNTKDTI